MNTIQPGLIIYGVKNRGERKPFICVGALWPYEGDLPGYTLELEAFPAGERVLLVEPKTETNAAHAEKEILF